MIINQDYLKIFPENCILQKEFFGENSQIKIKIIREFPKVNLIGGTFGPFSKKTTIKTFLWLGVFLEKTGFCEILNPSWFKLKWMDKNILKEKRETTLTNIPFNYIEISYIFFKKKNNPFKSLSNKNDLSRRTISYKIYKAVAWYKKNIWADQCNQI